MVTQSNYNINIKDHRSQITIIIITTTIKFEILQGLQKCNTQIQSEQMLLENMVPRNLGDAGLP